MAGEIKVGAIQIAERSSAPAPVAGQHQIYALDSDPTVLMQQDDAGNQSQIVASTGYKYIGSKQAVDAAFFTMDDGDFPTAFDGTYIEIYWVIRELYPSTNAQHIWVQLKELGAFVTGAEYAWCEYGMALAAPSQTGVDSDTRARITPDTATNVPGDSFMGWMRMTDPADAVAKNHLFGMLQGRSGGGRVASLNFAAKLRSSNQPNQGIRIFASLGNINCKADVFGLGAA